MNLAFFTQIYDLDQSLNFDLLKFGFWSGLTRRKDWMFSLVRLCSFNDSLKSGGDFEWGNRVYRKGYKLVYWDKAVVTHPARNCFKEVYTKALRVGGGLHDINQSSNQLESLYKRVLPPVRRIIRILRDDRVSTIWLKIKVIFLVIFLKYAALLEEIKLGFGGNPRRS